MYKHGEKVVNSENSRPCTVIGSQTSRAKDKVAAKAIMERLASPEALECVKAHSGTQVNYRLGDDTDRQKSNYLVLTPSGHVTNQKCRILLTDEQSSV
jgi:hypothetical protein